MFCNPCARKGKRPFQKTNGWRRGKSTCRFEPADSTTTVAAPRVSFHRLAATSISFGSTPAIKSKSRSRCRSGMPAKMACVAIRQSFADRGVTPAQRHRAYRCAALRAASRVSGKLTNGNSPRARSQRVNRSGLSAPCRTSCRIVAVSQTGSLCSRASVSSATSTRSSPRR
jgi:hypothetical protein